MAEFIGSKLKEQVYAEPFFRPGVLGVERAVLIEVEGGKCIEVRRLDGCLAAGVVAQGFEEAQGGLAEPLGLKGLQC